MRLVLISGALAVAALALAPTAGATCHFCLYTDPIVEYLRGLLS